jgi:hypothetical protein
MIEKATKQLETGGAANLGTKAKLIEHATILPLSITKCMLASSFLFVCILVRNGFRPIAPNTFKHGLAMLHNNPWFSRLQYAVIVVIK